MLEPDKNPNSRLMVDPTGWLRHLMRRQFDSVTDLRYVNKRRAKAERKRQHSGDPHVAEYFHQLDDPYSHLTAQVLATFAERYDVVIKPHLIRASGGKNQPEAESSRLGRGVMRSWLRRIMVWNSQKAHPSGQSLTVRLQRDGPCRRSQMKNLLLLYCRFLAVHIESFTHGSRVKYERR